MRRLEAQTKRGISNVEMMVSTTGVMLSSRNDFGLPERILHFYCIVLSMTYEKSSKRTHLQLGLTLYQLVYSSMKKQMSHHKFTITVSLCLLSFKFQEKFISFFSTSKMTFSLSSLSFSFLEVESSRRFTICHIAAVWVLGFPLLVWLASHYFRPRQVYIPYMDVTGQNYL